MWYGMPTTKNLWEPPKTYGNLREPKNLWEPMRINWYLMKKGLNFILNRAISRASWSFVSSTCMCTFACIITMSMITSSVTLCLHCLLLTETWSEGDSAQMLPRSCASQSQQSTATRLWVVYYYEVIIFIEKLNEGLGMRWYEGVVAKTVIHDLCNYAI